MPSFAYPSLSYKYRIALGYIFSDWNFESGLMQNCSHMQCSVFCTYFFVMQISIALGDILYQVKLRKWVQLQNYTFCCKPACPFSLWNLISHATSSLTCIFYCYQGDLGNQVWYPNSRELFHWQTYICMSQNSACMVENNCCCIHCASRKHMIHNVRFYGQKSILVFDYIAAMTESANHLQLFVCKCYKNPSLSFGQNNKIIAKLSCNSYRSWWELC